MRSFACLIATLLAAAPAVARPRGLVHNLPGAPRAPAPAATVGPTLLYFGGPVIPNAKVYAVWWGGAANISRLVTASHGGIADFFAGVLDSAFMDGLAQYGTHVNAQTGSHSGSPGTDQYLGRGAFAGAYDLAGAATGTVTDAAVQSTLETAIASGRLPASDANSLYAIYFPAAVTVTTSDGGISCSNFGGYHYQSATAKAAYLVLPDCTFSFSQFCSVSSHELAEAVTDLIPTPGSHPDWPQAWNDSQGNEAGDLCQGVGSNGTLTTATGTFTVQKIWDERSQSCRVTAHAAQDFSVGLSPRSLSLAAGGSAQVTVQTATVAGNAQALTLSVAAPAGVTATLTSSSVGSGDAPSLTVTSAGTAAVADGQIVVTAHGTSGIVHSAALLLQPTAGDVADAGSPADAGADSDGGTDGGDGGTGGDATGAAKPGVASGGCGSAPSSSLSLPLLLALLIFGRARPNRRFARPSAKLRAWSSSSPSSDESAAARLAALIEPMPEAGS